MAFIKDRKKIFEPFKLTEKVVGHAVSNIFGGMFGHNDIFLNVFYLGSERDVLVVTSAGYIYEIEIKLTLSDWTADQKKDKWFFSESGYRTLPDGRTGYCGKVDMQKNIKQFSYAVPRKLIEKCPDFVPPSTGLIAIDWENMYTTGRYVADTIREPTARKTEGVNKNQLLRLYKKSHNRWCNDFLGRMNDLSSGAKEVLL